MRVFTYIDMLFFPHSGQFSKRLCDFNPIRFRLFLLFKGPVGDL